MSGVSSSHDRLSIPPAPAPELVGILALQGSFQLHRQALDRLGVATRLVRRPEHLAGLSGLVIPGGESTVMSLLARKYGLFEPLRDVVRSGLPAMGTCAGAILLGHIADDPPCLGVVPIRLERNAYGSQVDSFTADLFLQVPGGAEPFHGVFIRAPAILEPPGPASSAGGALRGDESTASVVRVLGRHRGQIVLAQAGNVLLATFHPELTDDLRVHRYFLALCRGSSPAPNVPVQESL